MLLATYMPQHRCYISFKLSGVTCHAAKKLRGRLQLLSIVFLLLTTAPLEKLALPWRTTEEKPFLHSQEMKTKPAMPLPTFLSMTTLNPTIEPEMGQQP